MIIMEEFRLQALFALQFLCVCKHRGSESLTHKIGHKKNNQQKHLSSKDPRTTEFRTLNQILHEICYHTDLCSQPSSELFHILFRVQLSEQDLQQLVYYLCNSAMQNTSRKTFILEKVKNVLVRGE